VIASALLVSARAGSVLPALVIASCLADADPIETGESGGSAGDTGASTGAPDDALVVFVSSMPVSAGFGGVESGDALCLARASAGSLPGTQYRAWLGTYNGVSAAQRIGTTDRPYVLTDFATVVAYNSADLQDGFIEHPIDLDEHGQPPPTTTASCATIPGTTVWTGAGPDGGPTSNDCLGWTLGSGDGASVGVIAPGHVDATWTSECLLVCEQTASLYCFQLPE
jgi:hypothetical protein